MPQVCTILGPMRCGTSILSFSLFKHPEIYGIMNLSEKLYKSTGLDPAFAVDLYVPLMKIIAENEPRNNQDEKLFERQAKIVVERNHLPGNLHQKIDGAGFKILTIVRDPRELILSALRWHKMPRHNKKGKSEGSWVEGFLGTWKKAIDAHIMLSENNDTYLIRHEDLCNQPQEEALKLFNWMEISTESEFLESFAASYQEASVRREEDESYEVHLTKSIVNYAKKAGYSL